MQDFRQALERLAAACPAFLAVGHRWDTDILDSYDFERADWEQQLRTRVLERGRQRTPEWIDYFAFSRGLYDSKMPEFVIGRVHWDNWLLWKVCNSGKPVIDLSPVVVAVHQNHDYGYHPQGKKGVWHGAEAVRNYELAGGWNHLRTIADATEVLGPQELRRNRKRHWAAIKRYFRQAGRVLHFSLWHPIWFALLGMTRPLRSALGLRNAETLRRTREKI
jgi:hypothetical protein